MTAPGSVAPSAPPDFRLDGRTVIVTGASSGIGRHVAGGLIEAGAFVVAAARRESALLSLGEQLGPRLIPVVCDVTAAPQREQLVRSALVPTGRIDVLVNNAGAADPEPAIDGNLDDFERTLQLNLTAVFALSAAVAKHMAEVGSGTIVNVASIMGLVAAAPIHHAAYCAAKGGVIAMTRQLACEWASLGIRVNALAPGWFPSELTEEMFANKRSAQWLARNTPMQRVGRLSELDGPLLLLCTEAGSFITGQTITVDGGWTAR